MTASKRKTGIPLAQLKEVMEGMKKAKFGAIFFGMGVTMTRGKHLNSEAVLALARDMNKHTRWVAKPMRGHGNVTGADNVVSWSTGYPFGIHLGRGYPKFQSGRVH
jgi:formylmethanofuran dehydrogenase subunit B